MIQTQKLSKVFRTEEVETLALNEVSLSIKEGEFVAVMGPSGCGKSTLLNVLGLLDKPSGGTYTLMGEDVSNLRESEQAELRKGKIGFIFQSFNLIDELNVFENVELPLIYLKTPSSERKQKVHAILDKMDIGPRQKHFPQQLSGGQQQRVAVARAIITSPKLILADEPTGNLNSAEGKDIMDMFKELNDNGTTIIQVTHSELNASYGQRTINLLDGWVQK